MAGGETTVFTSGPDAYSFPLANLDQAGITKHFESDQVFEQQFVSAPAEQFGGIGPLFNQNSCEGCHVRNGKGTIPQFEGDPATGLLLRLSIPGTGNNNSIVPVPGFGGQLQNKAIFGVIPEGQISRTEITQLVTYLDGLQVELVKPTYTISNPYTMLPANLLISPRLAPAVHGMGLLEAIEESSILAQADENDLDGDGISGRPNYVWDPLTQQMRIGRFGWKAEAASVLLQSAGAANGDMGLTNYVNPLEECAGQDNCTQGTQEMPDIGQATTQLMAFYTQTLAVPAQRNVTDPIVVKGRGLFDKANCGACHIAKHTTGTHAIKALSNQTIFPYTDLLLHDMGDGLADNRSTFSATGREWKTPPLWGIGLAQVVNTKATFLHDGRARTLEEAILWHGGEAEEATEYFSKLSKKDREALIAFIKSL